MTPGSTDVVPQSEKAAEDAAVTRAFQLIATGVPIAAALLPVVGFLVRLIAFGLNDWMPASRLAFQASIGELGYIGFLATIYAGGATLIYAFVLPRRGRSPSIYPFYMLEEAWRTLGPTKERRTRLASRWTRLRAVIRQQGWRKATAEAFRWIRGRFRAPRVFGRLLVAFLNILLAVLLIAGVVFTVVALFQSIFGQTFGVAIQSVAGLIAAWIFRDQARKHGQVSLRRSLPVVLTVLAVCAVGSGLDPRFEQRPATFVFKEDSSLPLGRYQEVGRGEGFVYLVSCLGPAVVVAVPVGDIKTIVFDEPGIVPHRTTIQEAMSGRGSLEVGFRKCQ